MARDHGRIFASIWSDPDFIACTPGAQRLYAFLLTQADLSHAGVIAMRLRRWATRAAGITIRDLERDLDELEAARFVVVDHDTEEVLVRSFVRNDGVWRSPNVMKAAVKDAREILSPSLRAALAVEITRLPLHELSDESRRDAPSVREVVSGCVDTILEDLGNPSANPSQNPSGNPSYARIPSPSPSTTPSSSASGGAAGEPVGQRTAATLLAEWIDHCDPRPVRRVRDHTAREIKALLDEGVPYDDVRRGLAAWHDKRLHPSTLPSVVHEIRQGPPARAATASTTDQRVEAVLALRDELRADTSPRPPAIGA